MSVFLAIVFTVVIGLFLGCMSTTSMKGWKKELATLIIVVCIGCGFLAMSCAERNSDVKAWNNGFCECGGEWKFNNVEHLINGGNLYYWYCEGCGRVIELHTQFTK